MADAHPGPVQIAEALEDLPDPPSAADVRAHLARCPTCAEQATAVREVTRRLAALPPVPMPTEVAGQIDAALAGAAPAAAVPAGDASADGGGARATVVLPTRRRLRPTLPGLAAAAALALLVAGATAGVLRLGAGGHGGNSTGAGPATGASAPPRFQVTASGRAYTPANLAGLVPLIVSGRAAAPVSGMAVSNAPVAPAVLPYRVDPAALAGCLTELSGGGPVQVPLAVDLGSFDGHPAAVYVLPTPGHADQVDVWVEGPGCAPGHDHTLYYLRTTRPTP